MLDSLERYPDVSVPSAVPLGGFGCPGACATRDEDDGVVAVRVLTVVVGLALVALCGIGVLVAALLERDRFGDRDGEPSTAYLLALAVGLVASFGLPLALSLLVARRAHGDRGGRCGRGLDRRGSRSQGEGVLG